MCFLSLYFLPNLHLLFSYTFTSISYKINPHLCIFHKCVVDPSIAPVTRTLPDFWCPSLSPRMHFLFLYFLLQHFLTCFFCIIKIDTSEAPPPPLALPGSLPVTTHTLLVSPSPHVVSAHLCTCTSGLAACYCPCTSCLYCHHIHLLTLSLLHISFLSLLCLVKVTVVFSQSGHAHRTS